MAACAVVLDLLGSPGRPEATNETLDALSVVKGLFTRIVREDQWDWFTVSRQLGYPSRRISGVISQAVGSLRSTLVKGDIEGFGVIRNQLMRLPVRRCLSIFLGRLTIANVDGVGWVYVLSSRELPDLLKIGMTTRTVEQRSQEINSATGVAIPFGVRRCWRVVDPHRSERLVHAALAGHRLRGDREFFRIAFGLAAARVEDVLVANDLLKRTLNDLVEP